MIMDINWLAVLVAGVVTFLLGGLWYGPLFGKVWRTAAGQAEPEPDNRKHPALVCGLSFVLMLIAAAALAITIGPAPTVTKAVGAGLIIGVGWVATSFGVNYLFAGRRLALLAVDAGYNVVLFAAMGLVLALIG